MTDSTIRIFFSTGITGGLLIIFRLAFKELDQQLTSLPHSLTRDNTTPVEVCALITSTQITQAFGVDQSTPLLAFDSKVEIDGASGPTAETCDFHPTGGGHPPALKLQTQVDKKYFDFERTAQPNAKSGTISTLGHPAYWVETDSGLTQITVHVLVTTTTDLSISFLSENVTPDADYIKSLITAETAIAQQILPRIPAKPAIAGLTATGSCAGKLGDMAAAVVGPVQVTRTFNAESGTPRCSYSGAKGNINIARYMGEGATYKPLQGDAPIAGTPDAYWDKSGGSFWTKMGTSLIQGFVTDRLGLPVEDLPKNLTKFMLAFANTP